MRWNSAEEWIRSELGDEAAHEAIMEYEKARKASYIEREWFKGIMGITSSRTWTVFILLAMVAMLWLMGGCDRTFCVDSCLSSFKACLGSSESAEERLSCMRMHSSCVSACANSQKNGRE